LEGFEDRFARAPGSTSRTVLSRGWGRVELLVDVLNALNCVAEEALANDYVSAPNFGQPTIFTDPRRAMIGVKFKLAPE
jgi:hypothetical protein